ncbi:hypothetical protein ACFFKU_06920 [Kineococcus gynurae]|uniref:Ferrous iron transport protein A n=1 Tax=Kineococcus gynurae TaxID=452979 RepID=A0ABV5LWW2_9ACTN
MSASEGADLNEAISKLVGKSVRVRLTTGGDAITGRLTELGAEGLILDEGRSVIALRSVAAVTAKVPSRGIVKRIR